MSAGARLQIMAITIAALAAVLLLALGTQDAFAAKTCDISGKERKLGATYVTSLKVRKVTCGKAQKAVKAYHQCRHRNGKAGKCSQRVKGFKCSDRRFDKIPTQYDSRTTCKKGSARIWHVYTQFT
jgi:hypothetical protein